MLSYGRVLLVAGLAATSIGVASVGCAGNSSSAVAADAVTVNLNVPNMK